MLSASQREKIFEIHGIEVPKDLCNKIDIEASRNVELAAVKTLEASNKKERVRNSRR